MNPTQTDPTVLASLPYWMQLFAFIAGIIFTLLTIVIIITQLVKKPILFFRLTKDIFFRITELQEAVFSNGVLVAKNEGILIEEVNFKLNKTDEPTKSFTLKVAHFGEKVRGLAVFSDHHFYSTSPISYIPVFCYYPFSSASATITSSPKIIMDAPAIRIIIAVFCID